jgi:hypothetical protein
MSQRLKTFEPLCSGIGINDGCFADLQATFHFLNLPNPSTAPAQT